MQSVTLGHDEAGSGPLLLLVHGFPFDRRMWAGQLAGLSHLRRVVAVDLRGRGKSAGLVPDRPSIDAHADDLARTIVALGHDQADVAAQSMGGYIAFALWRRRPEVVRSLILINTRAEADSPEARAGRDASAALVGERGTIALADQMLPRLLAPGAGSDIRALVSQMFEETPAETAAADLLAMRDRPDSTPTLTTISVPALVIHGEQDAIVSLQSAGSMAARIPGGRFVVVPGAGHLSPMENPEAVNAAVAEFLPGEPS
ncbi:MAG: alpha/beta fold hydrolase [Actinomycetota bacterium]